MQDCLTWKDIPADIRNALVVLYEDRRRDDLNRAANALNIRLKTLERYCRFQREFRANILGERQRQTFEAARALFRDIGLYTSPPKTEDLPPPPSSPHIPTNPPPLTDIHTPDPDTDQPRWLERLTCLARKGRITAMHLSDIHFPFQHNAALDIAYQLVGHAQPDVIVVGSDSADFALLSSFAHSPDLDEDTSDELDQFALHWQRHIAELKRRAPNAALVFIYGNHEWRILRFLEESAPKLRKTVMRLWRETIRQNGAVYYLGEVDWVRLGPVLIMHGNRVCQHVARKVLDDVGGQVNVQFGHVHRLDEFIRIGEDYRVWSKAGGCLCQPPHYLRGHPRSRWQLGTAVTYLDLNSRYARCDNLLFEQDVARIWVEYEREIFASCP